MKPHGEMRNSEFGIWNRRQVVTIPHSAFRIEEASMWFFVHKPGLLTTVQDLGRWGHQDRGVGVAGPMDAVSHRLANLLVGNEASAATLEITLIGPEVEFEHAALFAVTGA